MDSKKILTAAALLLISVNLQAQNNGYTLNGTLKNVSTGSKVFLVYFTPRVHKDSATVQNGAFEFKGDLSSPVQAQLFLPHGTKPNKMMLPLRGDLDFYNFYLDKGTLKVNGTDSVKRLIVTNSKINDEDKELSQTVDRLKLKINLIHDEYDRASQEKKKDKVYIKQSSDEQLKFYKEIEASKLSFAKLHPDSYVSLNAVFELARGRSMGYHIVDTAYKALSDKYKNTLLAIETKRLITTGLNTTVGAQALDIILPDANGKTFKLSDFKGKYVLLEFWASWCGPCRLESPNLVRAYEKYKNKNFTIFGVSLDIKRVAWLEAVAKDKIPYLQLDDMKGPQESEVAIMYGIQSIPESYIIDPTGKIIEKNLRGEALNKKLKELFNQ